MEEATWYECVELNNGKFENISKIKEVSSVHFDDFFEDVKSCDDVEHKQDFQAVKTVMETIQHLKRCSVGYGFNNARSVSDQYKILCEIFESVKIDGLFIYKNLLNPNTMVYIARICETCEVKSLTMKSCNLDSDCLKQFSESIKDAKLDRLDVTSNILTEDCMNYLAVICEICQVRSLKIENCGLHSEHFKYFGKNDKNIKIDQLVVSGNRMIPEGMSHLARTCAVYEVKSLRLRSCHLDGEKLREFAKNIANTKLKELDVSGNQLNQNCMKDLAEICVICGMKSLKLGSCDLGPEHIKAFSKYAEGTKIEELEVSFNPVVSQLKEKTGAIAKLKGTKHPVAQFANMCEICEVKKLFARGCGLESDHLQKFVKFAKNTKITEMDVGFNLYIDEESEIELQKLLKHNKAKAEAEADLTATVAVVHVKISTKSFYELCQDDIRVYSMNHGQKKGKVLIINNEFTGKKNVRNGSLVDLKNQENLWKELGFGVQTKKNLTADEMKSVCKEFAKKATDVSVVVAILMTHGGDRHGEEVLEGEDNTFVNTADLISLFNTKNSPHLKGIPKVIFLQACRGFEYDSDLATDKSFRPSKTYPLRSDMIITYPSQSGFVSFRHKENGSWLMNAICNVFMRHAHDTHIIDMLTMVNDAVGGKKSDSGAVQMSNQEYYLRKKLFLFPGWPN